MMCSTFSISISFHLRNYVFKSAKKCEMTSFCMTSLHVDLFETAKSRGGGGNLSFQDTGLCHSNRKSTTNKSGELSQKYTHKSGEISQKYTPKAGELLNSIPINPGMPKLLTNN